MLKNHIHTIILIFVMVLIAGCGSPATTTPAPRAEAPVVELLETAPPTPEPVATIDTWFKTYGGDRNDVCDDVLLTDDGGYLLMGTTNLQFQPVRRGDVYLIKTDAAGKVLWEKTYEREGYQGGQTVFHTSDGGLLISGGALSPDTNGMDVFLMKLDQDGNELWFKTVGGPLDEIAGARQMDDGTYILVGNIVDPDDFVTDPGTAGYGGFEGRSNIYLAKLDANGNEIWSNAFGGENNVLITGGVQTPDGGGLLLATILYFPESNDEDIWLLKVDGDGNEVWSRTWKEGTIGARDLVQTDDGNYLITGSHSPGGEGDSNEDFVFIKIAPDGNELWTSTFGDPEMIDYGMVLAETMDGGYVAAGERVVDNYTWDADISLVKIDESGQLLWEQIIETNAHCMFGTILQHPDGGYVIAGSAFNGRAFDMFVIKTDSEGNVGE
ncbi:MAG: PQQ-binding-like beta-propeller repeat protein [Chloroflexi bacterium]|nr:PQQ-binding-like beta-propeller repeat protein [Chloroflexota bacterium]